MSRGRSSATKSSSEPLLSCFGRSATAIEWLRRHWLPVRPVPSEVWQTAIRLSRHYTAKLGTRTLDVLHVALALGLQPGVFFTFDRRQWKLAKAVGLRALPTRP